MTNHWRERKKFVLKKSQKINHVLYVKDAMH